MRPNDLNQFKRRDAHLRSFRPWKPSSQAYWLNDPAEFASQNLRWTPEGNSSSHIRFRGLVRAVRPYHGTAVIIDRHTLEELGMTPIGEDALSRQV